MKTEILGFLKDGGLMSFAMAALYMAAEVSSPEERIVFVGAAIFFIGVKYADKWLRETPIGKTGESLGS